MSRRGLSRGSAAARLLGLRVSIPPEGVDDSLPLINIVCFLIEVSATADHSPRGVLANAVCLKVIKNPCQ